jgi:hypothetical protein
MNIIEIKDLCTNCHEAITNPVCAHCYLKQVVLWLKDSGKGDLESSIIYTAIERRLRGESQNEEKCILCKQNTLTICSYCFFELAIRVLKELNFPKQELEEFLQNFNYDEWHDSWHDTYIV